MAHARVNENVQKLISPTAPRAAQAATEPYVIDDYDQRPPFASFLPGIAGPFGVPLWALYVSRGQGLASFGVESKNGAIVEFQPANKAYQAVSLTGFRTFLKLSGAGKTTDLLEPFGALTPRAERRTQMRIGLNDLQLIETDPATGVQTEVTYFVLPQERFAGLVRKLVIRNTGKQTLAGELLDGLPAIIPFGVSNWLLKEMGNTVTAWMGVENLEARTPFYRVATSIEDRPEVEEREAGHFYLCFADADPTPLWPIVDPEVVFGANKALTWPQGFIDADLPTLHRRPQGSAGRIPCGFFGTPFELAPDAALTVYGLVGHVGRVEMINRRAAELAAPAYFERKHAEAVALAQSLTDAVAAETASDPLDRYLRQNFLDNVLRGGFPMILPGKDGPRVQYVYSRRHGDLERDYNFFTVPAEYWSQGNGAYRDVNQNRRSDVAIEPDIDAHTIETFVNLIQADGYNPLELRAPQLRLDEAGRDAVLAAAGEHPDLRARLSRPFTLGRLLNFVDERDIPLQIAREDLVGMLIRCADEEPQAVFHEGYWVDHWAYNLDLIDSYLGIYPDRAAALFFEKAFTYYDSAAIVPPRGRRYVEAGDAVRQYGTVVQDVEKAARIAARTERAQVMRGDHGAGAVYRTTLFAKLLGLGAVKCATLDPSGIGVEMEAGRPGWCDALNGLPGLFGSSLSETFELRRLVDLLRRLAADQPERVVSLPEEVGTLARALTEEITSLSEHGDEFAYWDKISTLREDYRARTKFGFSGADVSVALAELTPLLAAWHARIEAGLEKAKKLTGGLPPTYLVHEPTHWRVLTDERGDALRNDKGQRFVHVEAFGSRALPLYLEGAVKAVRSAPAEVARTLHEQVQASGLYDAKLGMYKVNASLADEPVHIGRTRAYTPGWLENESVFLHMHYKYLLALLQAGLAAEFWAEARRGLVPFMNPDVYGRSILENSSFIVSSAHPDTALHGRGFVARLSGSTAEFIHMWNLVTVGPRPFKLEDGELVLNFAPALPGWLFKDDGTLRFTFLGKVPVTYHHPARTDLFDDATAVQRVIIHPGDGDPVELAGGRIASPWAARIRQRAVKALDVYWGSRG